MAPHSLGTPKWGGSIWTKEAHVREAPRRKLPPLWQTQGRPLEGCPLPPPLWIDEERHPQGKNLTSYSCLWVAPLSSPLDIISNLRRRAARPSSLLRRRRALDGGALSDLLHRTCGSIVKRSYVWSLFEGLLHLRGVDLFMGVCYFKLP